MARARRDPGRPARPRRLRASDAPAAPSRSPARSSPDARSSAVLVRAIVIKRQAELVKAAHEALVTRLRQDRDFATRYPTLTIRPYKIGHEVGLRVGTRRTARDAEYDWNNAGVVLRLDQGVAPAGHRSVAALWAAHDVLTNGLIPRLLFLLPNVTRQDVVRLLKDAWPSTRGLRAKPMFAPRLITAAAKALARENPHWGMRGVREELARRLNVSPRTIVNLMRKKS
jgi:hypothetical protein